MASGSGLWFVVFFIITSAIYGYQPQVGASPDALVAFYNGDRMRILIAASLFSLNLLNLLWFTAAIRTTLADAGLIRLGRGRDGVQRSIRSIVPAAGDGGRGARLLNRRLRQSGCHVVPQRFPVGRRFVLTSFPRAMLIMSGSFGLWRAGRISNALFGAGVTAMVLVLLGGTTWMTDGPWAPRPLFADRFAHHRSHVGPGSEPRSFDPTHCFARWMVMPRLGARRARPSGPLGGRARG